VRRKGQGDAHVRVRVRVWVLVWFGIRVTDRERDMDRAPVMYVFPNGGLHCIVSVYIRYNTEQTIYCEDIHDVCSLHVMAKKTTANPNKVGRRSGEGNT